MKDLRIVLTKPINWNEIIQKISTCNRKLPKIRFAVVSHSCNCKLHITNHNWKFPLKITLAIYTCKTQMQITIANYNCKCKLQLQMQITIANANYNCKCKLQLQMQITIQISIPESKITIVIANCKS